MKIIGLTGSIGMGKSTTVQMLRDLGLPVHDADASVHALYSGRAAPLIEATFPGTTQGGVVDRQKLSAYVLNNSSALKKLESIVHPLVAEERERFLQAAQSSGAKMAVLDIPLLYETSADKLVDTTIVVTAQPEIQRQRVLQRPNMTPQKFEAILQKQVPDAEKRRRADYIVDTSHGLDSAREQIREILARIELK